MHVHGGKEGEDNSGNGRGNDVKKAKDEKRGSGEHVHKGARREEAERGGD